MEYKVYIENYNLIFEPKRGARIAIPLEDISEFTIDGVYSDAVTPGVIAGKPFLFTKKNPTMSGTIVIGFNKYDETIIQKKYYKKVINKYHYFKIKHIKNVFDIAEQIIDLKIHYDQVLIKQIIKYDNEDNEFYNMTKFYK